MTSLITIGQHETIMFFSSISCILCFLLLQYIARSPQTMVEKMFSVAGGVSLDGIKRAKDLRCMAGGCWRLRYKKWPQSWVDVFGDTF